MDSKKILGICISNKKIVILMLIVVFPFGLYCLWKGEHYSIRVRWIITVFVLWWGWNLLQSGPQVDNQQPCAAVQQLNGCTYYRDNSCNVISQSCQ